MSRTRRDKIDYPCDGRTKKTIPKGKVKAFISLFEAIKKDGRTYAETEEYCGFTHAVAFIMKDELFLTADIANKILSAYNKMIKDNK